MYIQSYFWSFEDTLFFLLLFIHLDDLFSYRRIRTPQASTSPGGIIKTQIICDQLYTEESAQMSWEGDLLFTFLLPQVCNLDLDFNQVRVLLSFSFFIGICVKFPHITHHRRSLAQLLGPYRSWRRPSYVRGLLLPSTPPKRSRSGPHRSQSPPLTLVFVSQTTSVSLFYFTYMCNYT